MARGLDETGRAKVRELVENGASGERVRSEINARVQRNDWDAAKNKTFVEWLRDRGYNESAHHLIDFLDE